MSPKPVLLLLHGALGDKRQLVPIKDYLSSVYDVHSLNFSGHGGESMPALFSIELFTENLMEYLEEYNLKNVKIFGYSMGGYVALNVARFTQRIGCIITYGTKFHWTPDSAQHEIKKLDPEKIRQKVPVFTE